jgi:hypothetical protein
MIGVDMTREQLDALRDEAKRDGNTTALMALEMVETVLMARHSLYHHIQKEREMRLRYHSALSKAKHWCDAPKPKGKKAPTKDELAGLLSNVRVEILTGLGELSDFEVPA